jgi:zinc protease
MIRAFFGLLVCMFTATPLWAEIKIEDVTSPGGIKAWLVEDHGIPFTALQIRFRGGTSLDPDGKRGAVMLMASLLEEGGGDLDAQGFAEARESLAAKFNFDADADSVSVSAQFLTENRDAAVALLRKALIDPHFDQSAIDRVRGQVLSIIAANATSPEDIAGQKFDAMLFGDHPYGSNGLGTEDSVKGLTHEDVQAAKDATMARDRLYVAAVGDIDPEALGRLLDGLFAGLPAKGAALPAPVTPVFNGTTTVVDFASPQSKVVFGQPGLKLADPDFYAAYVLNQILGGSGFSARLMDEVREKRGLTYGISTYLATMELSETWQGSFASGNASVGEAIKVVRDVWADTAENGVTEAELDAAKTYMTGSYPLRFDGNSTIAGILVGMQVDGMPIDYVTHRNARIEAVTLADVNRVAHELMKPDALTFVVVGKPDGLAAE